MANPSPMSTRPVVVKEELFSDPGDEKIPQRRQPLRKKTEHVHKEKQKSQAVEKQKPPLAQKAEVAESKNEDFDGIPYLSGKPFFDVVLAKSHVSPHYNLHLPIRIIHELPRVTVPVVLRYNRKNWDLYYHGSCRNPRFDMRWRKFVTDNDLKVGDACVFELMECSHTSIKFKVHILRGDLPPELRAVIDSSGTSENPIVLD